MKEILNKKKVKNPFVCLSKEEILSQLATARQEVCNGEVQDAMEVYDEIVKKYGL